MICANGCSYGQVSMTIANTRLRRCLQLIRVVINSGFVVESG